MYETKRTRFLTLWSRDICDNLLCNLPSLFSQEYLSYAMSGIIVVYIFSIDETRKSEELKHMTEYFAYEVEMSPREFRESVFLENLDSELLLFACRDTIAVASTRTISAVLKYRCNERRQSRYSMTRKQYSSSLSDSLPCIVHKSLCRWNSLRYSSLRLIRIGIFP